MICWNQYYLTSVMVQSAWAIDYTNCFSAEG